MRTSKKFLSMILAVIMIVGTFSVVASSYAFDDVEDYQNQIALMNELKIVEGYDDTTFGYGEDVQRWQMALWIAKIMTGKVYDAYVNWYSTENYTNFTDINPDQFYGSISYGVENGIILGKSDVSFDPTAGITFQEAFTMVVRMLGYGSSAMDATYPWSYVDKAIKLGLDNGLRADYNNEEVATREEIVVILYNALFAPKADGTTFGEKNFNLKMDTVVITGTVRGNMFTDAKTDKKAADDTHYVTFSILDTAANKLQTGTSYYLPRSAFAPFLDSDDLAATLKIGYSYDVVTKDDYTTLLYVRENDVVVVDQDKLTGGTSAGSTSVTIGADAYKAVSSYSTLAINNQGTKTTKEFEIVLYNGRGSDVSIGGSAYLRNANLDIVDEKGNVILTFYTHAITGLSYPEATYLVYEKLDNGTWIYREPTGADWDKAAKAYRTAYGLANSVVLYTAIGDTYANINKVNAYSDTWLFDDDGNSDYDRGIYMYYSFGKITTAKINDKLQLVSDAIPGDGRLDPANTVYDSDVAYIDVDKYIAGEDYVLTAKDVVGKFCLYAYNPVTNVFYLKKTYDVQKGYVTTVNKPGRTITFDQVYYGYLNGTITGNTYKVGVENLPGGNYDSVLKNYRDFDTLKGRTVNYVLDEKYTSILRIVDYGTDVGYVVIKDNIASVNTTGYANVLAYANSNIASVITIASVDGYTTVQGYAAVNNVQPGDLFSATVDALGMYHLTYIAPGQFDYFASQSYTNSWTDVKNNKADPVANPAKLLDLNFTNGVSYTEAQKKQTISVDPVTGKPSVKAPEAYYDNNLGVAKAFGNFTTNKDTVIILVNEDGPWAIDQKQLVVNGYLRTLNFEATKGVPADGSHIYMMDAYDWSNKALSIAYADAQHTASIVNPDPYYKFGTRIFAAVDGDNVAKFVYVVNGTWGGNIAVNPAVSQDYLDSNDTIIYVDEHTMATMVATNQTATGLGVSVGTVYKYDNAIDFIRGGITSAYTGAMYNQRLYAGRFYYVEDGYVVGEVTVGATKQPNVLDTPIAYDIEVVRLAFVNDYVSVYQRWDGTAPLETGLGGGNGLWTSTFGKPIIYKVDDMYVTYEKSSTVLDEALTSKPKDIVKDVMKVLEDPNAFVTAYVYTGLRSAQSSLDGVTPRVYSGQKKLFITADYVTGNKIAGTELTTKSVQTPWTITDTAGNTQTFNGFLIDKQTYDAISYYINAYNDDKNQQYAGVNTTMRAYEGATVIPGTLTCGAKFINGTTTIATYVEQGFAPRYFLELKNCVIHDFPTAHAYIQWTNPYNTNETYTLWLLDGVSN